MRHITTLAATFVTLLALAACSPGAIFTIDGTYDMTLTVVESTNPMFPVGEVDSAVVGVETTADAVVMDLGASLATLTGTRSGNSVTLTGVTSGNSIEMDLLWTSDDAFEGTGRIDYADSTYAEFTAVGQAVVAVTSQGASPLVGFGD